MRSSLRIEPFIYDQKRTLFVFIGGVMPGQHAGSDVGKHNAERPKQAGKRFNSITKTIHFAHLQLYYLSLAVSQPMSYPTS